MVTSAICLRAPRNRAGQTFLLLSEVIGFKLVGSFRNCLFFITNIKLHIFNGFSCVWSANYVTTDSMAALYLWQNFHDLIDPFQLFLNPQVFHFSHLNQLKLNNKQITWKATIIKTSLRQQNDDKRSIKNSIWIFSQLNSRTTDRVYPQGPYGSLR